MTRIRFIHTSDVHLGHQQFNLEQRFRDFGEAFRQVVQGALEEKVDFVLIGGDFFHKRAIDAETLRQAMELLAPLKEAKIPVVAIEGNHDKAFYQEKSSWLNLLNSLGYLILLKPVYMDGKAVLSQWDQESGAGSIVEIAGTRIMGLGYLGATTSQRLTEVAEQLPESSFSSGGPFTIMVLHAAVDKLLGQDLGGVKKEVMEQYRDKIDYVALGHVHTRQEIDNWIFNPGSLENCHIDEAKAGREKGFYLVTISEGGKQVEYIPSIHRKTFLLTVDIGGSTDPVQVRERLLQTVNDEIVNGETPIIQISLKGEIEFSTLSIDVAALTREVKENTGALYVEILNQANLPPEELGGSNATRMNRLEIERQVLKQLLKRSFPGQSQYEEQLLSLVLKVKEAALQGEPVAEIVAEVSALAEQLPEIGEQSGTDEHQVAAAQEVPETQEAPEAQQLLEAQEPEGGGNGETTED